MSGRGWITCAVAALLAGAGCGSTPQSLPDAGAPDAPLPPDAQLPALGPSFVLDDTSLVAQ